LPSCSVAGAYAFSTAARVTRAHSATTSSISIAMTTERWSRRKYLSSSHRTGQYDTQLILCAASKQRSFRRKAWQLSQVHSVTSLHLWASAPGAAGVRVCLGYVRGPDARTGPTAAAGANVDYPLTRAGLCDSQRVYDPFELLADAGGKAG